MVRRQSTVLLCIILGTCLGVFPAAVLAAGGKSMEETAAWRVTILFMLVAFLSFLLEGIFHNLERHLKNVSRFHTGDMP